MSQPTPGNPVDLIRRMTLTREEAERRRSAEPGPIEEAFYGASGRVVHKWTHFLPVYDRYLAPYRNRRPAMLEIGVNQGGSLDLWRAFFGPDATIFGIDIDPACAARVSPPNQVRIGSQDDRAFLHRVVDEMGALDLVLDDGSHVGRHQEASFRALWPRLAVGGLYMIEDLHSSYWQGFWEGGMRKPGTGIEMLKLLIDDQHAWYHGEREMLAPRHEIGAIHIHDSIAVIEKVHADPPGHVKIG